MDESVLRRWMSLEMGKVNDGVVSARKSLEELLAEEKPSAVTRGGKPYRFDKNVIHALGKALPAPIHRRLRLPMIFFFDMEVADSCFLADAAALEALQALGDLSGQREMQAGRAWVGRAIVFSIIRKYPSVVQIMMR
jgi:hypothetical protein